MTTYVDDMRRSARVGNIRANWSHLFADTTEELLNIADKLGLRAEWIQHAGTTREHFDVTEAVRKRAVQLGAVEITYPRGTAELLDRKRAERASRALNNGGSNQ